MKIQYFKDSETRDLDEKTLLDLDPHVNICIITL